jgi:hypothetical protein
VIGVARGDLSRVAVDEARGPAHGFLTGIAIGFGAPSSRRSRSTGELRAALRSGHCSSALQRVRPVLPLRGGGRGLQRFRPQAISLVMAGGIVGGIVGPRSAAHDRPRAADVPATYASLLVFGSSPRRSSSLIAFRPAAGSARPSPRARSRSSRATALRGRGDRRRARLCGDELPHDGDTARDALLRPSLRRAAGVIAAHVVGMFAPAS